MSAKLEQLKKSLGNLSASNQVYTSGGRLVPLPDRQAIESKLEPKRLGAERGASELPPLGTTEPDEVEQRIVDVYQEILTDTAERVSETAGTFNSRIQSINVLSQLDDIVDGCRSAMETFKTQVMADEGTLKDRYRDVVEKEADFQLFKSDYGIRRSPQLPSNQRVQIGWAIIAVLFLFESFVNAGYLSEGNQAGLVGAYAQSFSFSAVNILVAYFVGMKTCRMVSDSSTAKRRFGMFATGFGILFAVFINLALAHYRDVSSSGVSSDLGQVALQKLLSSPFGFTEIQSLVLFSIGFLFWLIATVDFYGLDDPYPGYGKVARARQHALRTYESDKQALIDDLDDMRNEEEDSIKGTRTHLTNLQSQLGTLVESRKALFAQWEECKKVTLQQCSEMLGLYRDANKQARSKAPKSFSKKLSPIVTDLTTHETPVDQDKLKSQVEEGRAYLKQAQEEFYTEFNRALEIFRQIEISANAAVETRSQGAETNV